MRHFVMCKKTKTTILGNLASVWAGCETEGEKKSAQTQEHYLWALTDRDSAVIQLFSIGDWDCDPAQVNL